MVPNPESSYFPSLDKCLNGGNQILISWKTAFQAILDADNHHAEKESAVQLFFADSKVQELLSQPFDAFPEPSPQSKSAFETKTKAINVATSSGAPHDISQIKEDALWLSNEAKIDEVSALRIVVEECQSRASALLLGPLSLEEFGGIQEAASSCQAAIPRGFPSQGFEAAIIQSDFDKAESRRSRILGTYLSERRFLLQCVNYLLQSHVQHTSDIECSGDDKEADTMLSSIEQIAKSITLQTQTSDKWLCACLAGLEETLKSIDGGCKWLQESIGRDNIQLEWLETGIAEATHTLEIVSLSIAESAQTPSSAVVLTWLKLFTSYNFLHLTVDESVWVDSTSILAHNLQSLAVVVSFQIFTVGSCIQYIQTPDSHDLTSQDDSHPYLLKMDTIDAISDIMMELAEQGEAAAGPAILAWTVILQAIRMRVQNNTTPNQLDSDDQGSYPAIVKHDIYQNTIDKLFSDGPEDPIDRLGSRAINGLQALDLLSTLALQFGPDSHFSNTSGTKIRIVILDLLQSSCISVGYLPEMVSAAMSTLTGGRDYWSILDTEQPTRNSDPIAVFFEDDGIISSLLMNARSRYPFEALPFLGLVRALAPSTSYYGRVGVRTVIDFLEQIPSFTHFLPDGFRDWKTISEEENNNYIQLTKSFQLFHAEHNLMREAENKSTALIRADEDLSIPAGTNGRMISDKAPLVALWFHEYSGFKYLGKLLETFLASADQIDATSGEPADREVVSEIVSLLALILKSLSRNGLDESKAEAIRVLEVASSGLHRNRDITTVIFDIFEEELHRQSMGVGSGGALDILKSCTEFIHTLITITPARVWPFLGRSSLLELDRGSSRLSAIVGSVELVTGHYDFMLSCVRIYEALVEDLATNVVSRRCRARSSTRFGGDLDMAGTGVPEHVLSKVLLSFTRFLVDALENSCTWKFFNQNDYRQLRRVIAGTFNKVLHYAYGIGESVVDSTEEPASNLVPSKIVDLKKAGSSRFDQKERPKMMAAVEAAALYIADSFLSISPGSLRVQPILLACFDGLEATDTTLQFHETRLCVAQVKAVLSFTTTLLRVSATLGRHSSQLELQLFRFSPLIARLYAVNDAYRSSIVELFEALIVSASVNTTEPPSLLGYLGLRTSRNFLHILSNLDKPLSRKSNFSGTIRFFSKVMSSRQQWFATYLLTGRTSKDATMSKDLSTFGWPILNTALDSFASIGTMSKIEAIERLGFIAMAQNYWPWATYGSQKHTDFIKHISEFVGTLKPLQPGSSTEAIMAACYQTKLASLIAEILAMNLFHSRQTGSPSSSKDLLPNIDYFTRFAVGIPNYNSSLHANLKRNFETQYSGSNLLDFKRSSLESQHLGSDYFYDLPLMNKMLSFDPAWRRRTGFGNEVAMANVNLSLVDAQISLLNGWKFLALELSTNLAGQPELQKKLARVATDCLLSNKKSQDSEEVFRRLNQTRADLALILVQRLVEVKSDVPELHDLLPRAWDTIRQSNITFELALNSGDASYYRSLLKLLFLGLRVHSDSNQVIAPPNADFRKSAKMAQSAPTVSIAIEILEYVVAKGLRDLVAFVHDKPAESSPQDIALITGILQACLRIPSIEFCYSQIVTLFVQSDAARVATTLFSWSDTLAVDGDPIYGELSILYILELSTVPAMAEQLAIEGILGHIAAANITSYLRRSNVSPFAEGAGIQRCYSIWVRGVLPLLLNLLDAVGISIAAEVSIFLNQFPNLLQHSITALTPPEYSRAIIKAESKVQYITLGICSEAHTLSLLLFALNGLKEKGVEISEINWDSALMLDNAREWINSPQLRNRILPMGEAEVAMNKRGLLIEKVKQELLGVRDVLSAGEP